MHVRRDHSLLDSVLDKSFRDFYLAFASFVSLSLSSCLELFHLCHNA